MALCTPRSSPPCPALDRGRPASRTGDRKCLLCKPLSVAFVTQPQLTDAVPTARYSQKHPSVITRNSPRSPRLHLPAPADGSLQPPWVLAVAAPISKASSPMRWPCLGDMERPGSTSRPPPAPLSPWGHCPTLCTLDSPFPSGGQPPRSPGPRQPEGTLLGKSPFCTHACSRCLVLAVTDFQ